MIEKTNRAQGEGTFRGYGGWPLLLGLASFLVYLLTLCPTIYWRDGAEFQDIAFTLGIAHPTGSPVYAMLAHLITWIPFGEIAFRVNLLSALAGSASVAVVYMVALGTVRRLLPSTDEFIRRGAAVFGSLAFGFAPSVWLSATVAEVYTMLALGLLLTSYLLVLAWERRSLRFLFASAFVYGLLGGVHGTAPLYLPAFAWIGWGCLKGKGVRQKAGIVLLTAVFCITGLTSYAYLPLRSVTDPPIDWGNPETVDNFVRHVTDRKDEEKHFQIRTGLLFHRAPYFARLVALELSPYAAGLAACGLFVHFRRRWRAAMPILLVIAGNLFFFLPAWNSGTGYLPSFCGLSIASSVGAAWLCSFLQRPRTSRLPKPLALLLIAAVVIHQGWFWGHFDKSDQYFTHETAREEILRMNEDSMVLGTLFWFPFRYLQDVERLREDISIILVADVLSPKMFNPLGPERFPGLRLPGPEMLNDGTDWIEYGKKLIEMNVKERTIYWEPDPKLNRMLISSLIPRGLFFEISPVPARPLSKEDRDAYCGRVYSILEGQFEQTEFFVDPETRRFFAFLLYSSANYFRLSGRLFDAIYLTQVAVAIFPDDAPLLNDLGVYLAMAKRHEEAILKFEQARKVSTKAGHESQVLMNLGLVYTEMGNRKRGRAYLEEALEVAPRFPEAHQALGNFMAQEGHTTEAIALLRRGLSLLESAPPWKREAFLESLREIEGQNGGAPDLDGADGGAGDEGKH